MQIRFKKTLLASSVASVFTAGSGMALGQEAEATINVETITVQGFRSSLMKAREVKKEALISQDTIVAEDIADFPDLNLADSLQRIPGVAITREGGEGRQITLRGLGPDFTRVQVNGMEALGTSSSPMDARGAVTRTRAFDFNIFASELFNQIDVKKTWSADQEEGGIAGTVNLHTARPFDYDGFTAVATGLVGTNSNTDITDPRVAALVSDTWGQFGALFSVAYSERHTNENGTNTTRWRQETGKTAADESDVALQALLDSGELWFPRGHRYSVWENDQTRLGVTGALQYSPSERFTLSLDGMYGKLENDLNEHHIAVKDNKIVKELEYIDNGGDKEVVYASYEDATWRAETRKDYNESLFSQITLSADWQISDKLEMYALVGHSSTDYDQPKVNKANIHAYKKVDLSTDFRSDRFYGLSLSPGFDVTDRSEFEVKDLYFQSNYIDSEFDNLQIDFDYLVSDSTTLSFGVNYKKFENNGFERVAKDFPGSDDTPLNQGDVTLTDDRVALFTTHPDLNWVSADIDALQQYYGLDGYALTDEHTIESSDYTVGEETQAAYMQLGHDFYLGDSVLRGSIGVRYFETELSSSGISQGVPTEQVRKYNDVLPSLNLVYEINDSMQVRFGASENITRPSLGALGFYANVSQTSLGEDDIGKISVGNPNLAPFESQNFDLAFEWYMGEIGIASFAVFYKDINNFIVTETEQVIYSSLNLPADLLPAGKTMDDIFNVTSPQNSDASEIQGFEAVFQRDLDFLPKPFDDLGLIANYTYADGETLYRNVQATGEDEYKQFQGLSKHSYNITTYYETDNWGARIALSSRSDYITAVEGGLGDEDERGYHGSTHVDFSAFYWVNDYLKLNLEGINLTDEREELYSDSSDRAYNTTRSGRTLMAGLTVKF